MRLLALGFVALLLALAALPNAGGEPQPKPPSVKQLQRRVAKLESRVGVLEAKVTTLRTLICLQLPSC